MPPMPGGSRHPQVSTTDKRWFLLAPGENTYANTDSSDTGSHDRNRCVHHPAAIFRWPNLFRTAVGLCTGLIFGMGGEAATARQATQLMPSRSDQHSEIRAGPKWNDADTGSIHGRIGRYVRVREKSYQWKERTALICSRFFMAIGSAIRTDTDPRHLERFRQAQRRPVVLPLEARHPAWTTRLATRQNS
jgi:hypothetical protein